VIAKPSETFPPTIGATSTFSKKRSHSREANEWPSAEISASSSGLNPVRPATKVVSIRIMDSQRPLLGAARFFDDSVLSGDPLALFGVPLLRNTIIRLAEFERGLLPAGPIKRLLPPFFPQIAGREGGILCHLVRALLASDRIDHRREGMIRLARAGL
jgi:hypothetical protein